MPASAKKIKVEGASPQLTAKAKRKKKKKSQLEEPPSPSTSKEREQSSPGRKRAAVPQGKAKMAGLEERDQPVTPAGKTKSYPHKRTPPHQKDGAASRRRCSSVSGDKSPKAGSVERDQPLTPVSKRKPGSPLKRRPSSQDAPLTPVSKKKVGSPLKRSPTSQVAGRGEYGKKLSPTHTPPPARRRGSTESPPARRRGSTESPPRGPSPSRRPLLQSSPACSTTSKASSKRRGEKKSPISPSVSRKMDGLTLLKGRQMPNTIDWQAGPEVDNALKVFFPETNVVDLSHPEKVEMLAKCYTPGDMKPVVMQYIILTGVQMRDINFDELKNRASVGKAMAEAITKGRNNMTDLALTG